MMPPSTVTVWPPLTPDYGPALDRIAAALEGLTKVTEYAWGTQAAVAKQTERFGRRVVEALRLIESAVYDVESLMKLVMVHEGLAEEEED